MQRSRAMPSWRRRWAGGVACLRLVTGLLDCSALPTCHLLYCTVCWRLMLRWAASSPATPILQPRSSCRATSLFSPLQVQVIDGRIVVNAASLTVQAQEQQVYTRIVTGALCFLLVLTHFLALYVGGTGPASAPLPPRRGWRWMALPTVLSQVMGARSTVLCHTPLLHCLQSSLCWPPAPPLLAAEEGPRLNSLSYANRISNERWTPEDTELFYKVGGRLPSMQLSRAAVYDSIFDSGCLGSVRFWAWEGGLWMLGR